MTDKNGTPIEVGTVLRISGHPEHRAVVTKIRRGSATLQPISGSTFRMTETWLFNSGWLVDPAPEPSTVVPRETGATDATD